MNVKQKKLKFRYVFLPKEEGCSSSSSTTSSLVNFHFDDAGCFRVPVDVGFFLGLFGAGGWGMLSLLASFTGVGGCMWFIILAALQFSNVCVDYSILTIFIYYVLWFVFPCNGPLLRSGSKQLRLYLKICRCFIYFMALGYTLRSVKP